mmetsp:Transcript_8423/g.26008  ORF Transcript_8423/g.26008 Transcript_8423/m.26008 type:complete len:301 (-) Transcript_8423:262-1164(-)
MASCPPSQRAGRQIVVGRLDGLDDVRRRVCGYAARLWQLQLINTRQVGEDACWERRERLKLLLKLQLLQRRHVRKGSEIHAVEQVLVQLELRQALCRAPLECLGLDGADLVLVQLKLVERNKAGKCGIGQPDELVLLQLKLCQQRHVGKSPRQYVCEVALRELELCQRGQSAERAVGDRADGVQKPDDLAAGARDTLLALLAEDDAIGVKHEIAPVAIAKWFVKRLHRLRRGEGRVARRAGHVDAVDRHVGQRHGHRAAIGVAVIAIVIAIVIDIVIDIVNDDIVIAIVIVIVGAEGGAS